MSKSVLGMVVGSLANKAVLILDRLTVCCLIQESILCRTRVWGFFLFTEKFQVKFIVPAGVIKSCPALF